jgi:hypothetical protein
MPVWLPVPAVQIPRYCVSDVQHLWAKVPQVRIDALPQRFRLFRRVSGAWKRNGCDAIATAHTAQALSMKVPSRSSRGPLQLGLRVHHDRRRVPEAVFLRRAETGFLLLRPGPLPRGALADQGFAAIDFLFDQDTEGPPQCAFGSRAEVIGSCGVRQLFPNKQTCCAACGRSDKGQQRTYRRSRSRHTTIQPTRAGSFAATANSADIALRTSPGEQLTARGPAPLVKPRAVLRHL